MRHNDAQLLFKNADNKINLVVHRDPRIAFNQAISNGPPSRASSILPTYSPSNLSPVSYGNPQPHRAPSPLPPGPGSYNAALNSPVATLPYTVFPNVNSSGGYVSPFRPASRNSNNFSPRPSRDYFNETEDEHSAILNQVSLENFHFVVL